MAPDFFAHQERARRNTTLLVVLFAASVIAIIVSIYLVSLLIFASASHARGNMPEAPSVNLSWWNPSLFITVCLSVIAVVSLASLYKISELSKGGYVIAESLGGRRLSPDTTDPLERRLLNVVEEMAIASGVPTPPVYLMDHEPAINAFAAGFTPNDAVIGVTRGTVEKLSRDELQGVMGHEFSHILNGDMRTNIRLMGVLHGILIIGIIGYFVLRSSFYASAVSRRDRNSSPVPLILLGFALVVIGFFGTFFGNLIKAAVSRQREFLADASSVQFTRNPRGIANALKKIAGFSRHSYLQSPNAPQASHMYFAKGLASGLDSLLATHPPINERIRRLDPQWQPDPDADYDSPDVSSSELASGFASSPRPAASPFAINPSPSSPSSSLHHAAALNNIGQPAPHHVDFAAKLMSQLPPALTEAARNPYSARPLVFALLLSTDSAIRSRQLDSIAAQTDSHIHKQTLTLLPLTESLPSIARLPLLDLCFPALRSLTPGQYDTFRKLIIALVQADHKIDLFEWALQKVLLQRLDLHFNYSRPPRQRFSSLSTLTPHVATFLSILAHVGSSDSAQASRAFAAGADQLHLPNLSLRDPADSSLDQLDQSLDRLAAVSSSLKRTLLAAAAACISSDERITTEEAELLRAVAATLDCPIPPLAADAQLDQ